MDSTLNIYGLLTKKMYYQGKIVTVKLSNNCNVYKVTAKRGSSQEDEMMFSMTLYVFLVVYITDDLYISEIDV